jgi:hypothetical protein
MPSRSVWNWPLWLVNLSVNADVHLHVIPLPHEAAAPHV